MRASYEFDPCSLDGSDKDVPISIDSWKPTAKKDGIPRSDWRQQQNDGDYNQQPGLDDLKKIKIYLKKKYPDYQIMDAFGISCETLVAIKRNCYHPVGGIALDDQSKLYKHFSLIDKKISRICDALKFISDNHIEKNDTIKRMELKLLVKVIKKNTKEKADDEQIKD